MEEDPENCKESPHSVHANGLIDCLQLNFIFNNILTINTEFLELKDFNVKNGVQLEKLVECTLTTLFLVGLMMAG